MNRRAFLQKTAAGVGAAAVGSALVAQSGCSVHASREVDRKVLRPNDVVTLGKTGIRTSRLAIGTGSNGAEQRRLGIEGMVKLFRHAIDQGMNWLETADMYKTHPHVRALLKDLKRDKVVITSKTLSKDTKSTREDIERFRKELDTDYIDILLFHCMSDPHWPEKMIGPMEALTEAKEKGHIRAVGCSLHILGALEAACGQPWGDVYVARINPFAINMDVDQPQLIPRVEQALTTLHNQGKAVYGMKLLGGTDPHARRSRIQGELINESLRFALSRPYLDGFTIGFSRKQAVDDIVRRIERVQMQA